jgi:hypothetical protein
MGEIVAQNNSAKGPPCGLVAVYNSLQPADQADLTGALNDTEIRTTAIRRALAARGFQVSDHTISRHRRGECLCGTK